MPRNKQTLLGQKARKDINIFLQKQGVLEDQRRLAYASGVMAISGWEGVRLAQESYGVDIGTDELLQRFNAMLHSYGYRQALTRTAEVCAEAHLWMTLVALSASYHNSGNAPRHRLQHPRHLHLWVYQIDRKNRAKEDSPCQNCRQWVRHEFAAANGTDKQVG